jgi:hypothetical protein
VLQLKGRKPLGTEDKNMAVLRKAVLLKKLEMLGVFESRDGQALEVLTPEELEVELAFAQFGNK